MTSRRHNIWIPFLFIFLASCTPVGSDELVQGTETATPASVSSSPWIQVYFTDPTSPRAAEYQGGIDEKLVDAIDSARVTVDAAVYNLNLWSIRNALINAHQRGVIVRMVMESDNMENEEVQQLLDAGIPIIFDQAEGLMHNKYIIVDQSETWTGSMNFTTHGAYLDDNDILRIDSEKISSTYTDEFNEMFEQEIFGENSIPLGDPVIEYKNGSSVEILFSPEDGIEKRLLSLIQGARESIYFMASSFTSNALGEAIIEAASNGIKVSGVMDSEQIDSNQGTEFDPFIQAGLDVRRDGNPGLMHHKVIIIDGQIVVTGSYNFTASAEERNDENIVIINDPGLAGEYLSQYNKVYGLAEP